MTMRKEIVEVATREEAEKACPWAAVIIQVEGGWICFESVTDAEVWQAQV